MIWFLITILFLGFYNMKVAPVGVFHDDYADKDHSLRIKGLFTALIVISHFSQCITNDNIYDSAYLSFRSHFDQAVVCMFLFYSGYGVMEAISAKSKNYIKTMPVKRILFVLLSMIISVLIYIALQACYGNFFSIPTILRSFIGWDSVGNSNWYIHAILVLYIITYFYGIILPDRKSSKYILSAMVTVGAVFYALFLKMMGRPNYCYNTLIIYPMGMWFSLVRPKAEKFLKTPIIWLAALVILLLSYTFTYVHRHEWLMFYFLWTISFTAIVLLLSMKISLESPILDFFGRHIFSIYILQRIPMIVMQRAGFLNTHKYLGLLLVYAVTGMLAILFDKGIQRLHIK